MNIIFQGGPMDGEEIEILQFSPWLEVPVPDAPPCFNYEEGKPVTLRNPLAVYVAVYYADGHFGYEYRGTY